MTIPVKFPSVWHLFSNDCLLCGTNLRWTSLLNEVCDFCHEYLGGEGSTSTVLIDRLDVLCQVRTKKLLILAKNTLYTCKQAYLNHIYPFIYMSHRSMEWRWWSKLGKKTSFNCGIRISSIVDIVCVSIIFVSITFFVFDHTIFENANT